jgi:hypothetical protein
MQDVAGTGIGKFLPARPQPNNFWGFIVSKNRRMMNVLEISKN